MIDFSKACCFKKDFRELVLWLRRVILGGTLTFILGSSLGMYYLCIHQSCSPGK